MDTHWSLDPYLGILYCFVCYLLYEVYLTRKSISPRLPLIDGLSALLPRFVLSGIFAFQPTGVVNKGYRQFKSKGFQLIRNDGSVFVLPSDVLDELSSLPLSVASAHGALEHDLLGKFTGLDLILRSRLHHSIVQRKLTRGLKQLSPSLEKEAVSAIEDKLPSSSQWTPIRPFQLLAEVSARLAARALVGPRLCHNRQWLDISINYVENVFRTIVILRLFPSWTHPLLCRLLPSYWKCKGYIVSARSLLGPEVRRLLEKQEPNPGETDGSGDVCVLEWLVDAAKGSDRHPDVLVHIEVLLALASVHTTLLRMVNVLYDLIANPHLIEELRAEIECEHRNGWSHSSYSALTKLDSVLRESQRISPPTTLGMKRRFLQPYTFSNGLEIPANSYVCMPTYAIENDAENTDQPDKFDGLRSYRLRQTNEDTGQHQFTSTTPTVLNFGYGKTACPGRFFAERMLKMVFVTLLCEYDFEFLPGKGRPENVQVHEFLFPWPWDVVVVRQRVGGKPPF